MQRIRHLNDFKAVNQFLNSLISEASSRDRAYKLDNMRKLMAYLGNPQNSYRVIHVAGTSGKSSTCYFISAMLQTSGQKVGLTVSPHVYEVNERVQVDTEPMPEALFCTEFSIFLDEIRNSDVNPTYFEILVAFAYWEFARQRVDYAVVEVGLGGLLDGTNVVEQENKICVITDIGHDHTKILGNTLAEITFQKAGIVLPKNIVFSFDKPGDTGKVLRDVCNEKGARLVEVDEISSINDRTDIPLFQRRNWQLALAVLRYLVTRDRLRMPAKARLYKTASICIPARMEKWEYEGKTIIFDGAHNYQKLKFLVKSLNSMYPNRRIVGIVSMVKSPANKIKSNMRVLLPSLSYAIVTNFHISNLNRNATDSQKILNQCLKLEFTECEAISNPAEAIKAALRREEDIILIVGSLFLPSSIKPYLGSVKI